MQVCQCFALPYAKYPQCQPPGSLATVLRPKDKNKQHCSHSALYKINKYLHQHTLYTFSRSTSMYHFRNLRYVALMMVLLPYKFILTPGRLYCGQETDKYEVRFNKNDIKFFVNLWKFFIWFKSLIL